MGRFRFPRRLPVRFFLVVVAVVLVLPGLLFGGILLNQFAESKRADNRSELLATSNRLADAVDRELRVLVMATRVLATSERGAAGDLDAFASEARAAGNVLGRPIFLVSPDGARLVATDGSEHEFGGRVSDAVRRVAADRRPMVSNLLMNPGVLPHIVVLAPVLRGDQVVSVAGLSLDPGFFEALLHQQALSAGWIASLRDADGRLIARSVESERFLGTLASQHRGASGPGRVMAVRTLEGMPALAAYKLIGPEDWRVSVAVLSDVVDAPVRRSELWLALTGVTAMALGMVLAWQLASRISGPLSRLAQAGQALGAGRAVAPVGSRISEVQDVSAALTGAHAQLRERSASLAAERARLAAIIETVPVGLLIADASGRVVAGNRQFARMLPGGSLDGPLSAGEATMVEAMGFEAMSEDGRPVPASSMPLPRALAGEDPAELRARFRRTDGSWFWAQAVAAPIAGVAGEISGAVLALLDIDEAVRARQQKERWAEQLEAEVRARTGELERANRQLRDEVTARGRAEDQLRQAQKMEAVGRLTGGIAHDFNNLLTVILGSLELLRRRVTDARAARLVETAADGANRAADLIARLLAFSRRQPLLPQRLDVNQLVLAMSSLLGRTLGETIAIETSLADDLWPAMADPNQLESALLNLAVNARDAIIETSPGGGRLRIETANVSAEPGDVHGAGLRPGDYVVIATVDDGSGMSPDTLSQVFEPFFTTKPHGKGTGLGLSQVHGFAVQSGGYVTIDSQLGRGTRVQLFLPRATHDAVAGTEAGPRPPLSPMLPGACVLVVEDEPAVRLFAADALRLLGYKVLEAGSGEQALGILGRHPEIALMITDVVMPGMNGRELARQVQRRRPDLPILLASGYSRAAEEPEDTDWDMLPKPFSVAILAAKINDVLQKHRDRIADGDASTLHDHRMDA